MIVLQLLRKQRAPLWSFCLSNLSRRPMGDAALPTGKRLRIRCLNFADARLAILDLAVAHENFELPHHSSSYRNCRRSAARSKRGFSGSRAHHSRFARKQSVPPLSALGAAWRSASFCFRTPRFRLVTRILRQARSLFTPMSASATARRTNTPPTFAMVACFALTTQNTTSSTRKSWMAANRKS